MKDRTTLRHFPHPESAGSLSGRISGTVAAMMFLVLIYFSLSIVPARATGRAEEKVEKQPARCCVLGIAYNSGEGRVVLEQVCREPNSSVFYFRIENMSYACTYPPSTFLRDQSGHSYRMLSHFGLPDCTTGERSVRPNIRFTWSFEPLARGVRKISLVEEEDEATAGLSFWAWRDVNVSHCEFR